MTSRQNRKAEEYLRRHGWSFLQASSIVRDLINGGFIEEDTLTAPEQYARAAREWITTTNSTLEYKVYNYASGWSTESWARVLGKNYNEVKHNTQFMKDVFAAMVILAKEDGVDL